MRVIIRFLVFLAAALFVIAGSVLAQGEDSPTQVEFALQDLSTRLGLAITAEDLVSWTWQGETFPDTSLGCPQEGQIYAQVQTPGFRFQINYQGSTYDYRVSQDGSIVVLCQPAESPATATAEATLTPEQIDCGTVYVVQPGDTLARIAQRCGVTLTMMLQANPDIVDPSLIRVGQTINIPRPGDPLPTLAPTLVPTATPQTPPVPSVSISPVSGAPGTLVQVTASGFPANTLVEVGIGPVDSEYEVVSTLQTTANGTLNTQVSIPEFVSGVDEWVVVVAVAQPRAISNPFAVNAPEFTRATIYLIALEDAGQSGTQIGCGDSLVPVEVVFDPTAAPLTAALEQLFSIDTEFYGQSGLYNALYQSDLSIDEISSDESGAWRIDLSGTIAIGGACDVPRIQSQIEQTALQFSTVNTVLVFVNGQPLADALQ